MLSCSFAGFINKILLHSPAGVGWWGGKLVVRSLLWEKLLLVFLCLSQKIISWNDSSVMMHTSCFINDGASLFTLSLSLRVTGSNFLLLTMLALCGNVLFPVWNIAKYKHHVLVPVALKFPSLSSLS